MNMGIGGSILKTTIILIFNYSHKKWARTYMLDSKGEGMIEQMVKMVQRSPNVQTSQVLFYTLDVVLMRRRALAITFLREVC